MYRAKHRATSPAGRLLNGQDNRPSPYDPLALARYKSIYVHMPGSAVKSARCKIECPKATPKDQRIA